MTGTVMSFKRSYGFIAIDGDPGARNIFVFQGDIDMPGYRTLSPQQRVSFEIADSPKGPKAVKVRPMTEES